MKTCLAASLAALCLLYTTPTAEAAKYCGIERSRGGPYAVQIERGAVSCRAARAALRRYATSKAPCEGSGCSRRLRGWTCQTAAQYAFPRLFSCSRGQRWVAAYSIAD